MATPIFPAMKFLVILILAAEPIILPFNNALTCFEQGQAYIEPIATSYEQTDNINQGWYTPNGKWVYDTVKRICESTKMPMPKIMYSGIAIPNAFAYGSPKYGNRIAITQGMFDRLENEEIEAVIGHEIGHLKHKDVQVMMLASLLPSLLSTIGHSLIWSSMFNRRNSGGTMGIAFAAIIGSFILSLVCRSLGRTRESYADIHAVQHVPGGRRKLQDGLAKI